MINSVLTKKQGTKMFGRVAMVFFLDFRIFFGALDQDTFCPSYFTWIGRCAVDCCDQECSWLSPELGHSASSPSSGSWAEGRLVEPRTLYTNENINNRSNNFAVGVIIEFISM